MGEENVIEKSERRLFPSPSAAPWLVTPYGKSGTPRKQVFYNICQPNNRRKSIPAELIAKHYVQKPSHQGWLIVICNDDEYDYSTENGKFADCFLWNPTTLQTIPLPSLSKWYGKSTCHYFVDCVLSSPPHESVDDSMVLFLFTDCLEGNFSLVFLYCHPGDKKWKTYKWFSNIILAQDMASLDYFKGKFYVMCMFEDNLEIEKHKRRDGSIKLCVRMFEVRDKCSHPFVGGLEASSPVYNFVATDDQLYCIPIIYTNRGFGKVIIKILVMRLDFSAMAWKVVYSIGDHVLFIGSSSTKACCSAAETGLARGCVYFTFPGDRSLYKFDVQSTGNSVIMPCLELRKPWKDSEFIMMPNERKRKRKRKREEHIKNIGVKDTVVDAAGYKADIVGKPGGKYNVRDSHQKPCPFGILNEDMVESIASSLHRLDYIHLRSVSKAYRALLPMVKHTSSSNTTDTYLSPWLMFSRDHNCPTFSFINPMHNNESYLLNLSDLVGTVVRFQKGGWLLLSMGHNEFCLFFYNPLTRETITFPELPYNFTFSSVSFSSLPTSPDCVVFAIEQNGYHVYLYFIRKGEAYWSSCRFVNINTEIYTPSYNTPVFYNGVLYSVDYNGSLGTFNMEDCSWKVVEKLHQPFDSIYPSFLVECDGELLLVKLGPLGTLFGIFRLDSSRMEWVGMKNLGKHMLFVSHTSCFSAIAPPNSRMENKVYFPRLCMNGEGVLFYCLETGSYRSFGSRHSASDFADTEGWYSNCIWIEPNWTTSTSQEIEWVKPSS